MRRRCIAACLLAGTSGLAYAQATGVTIYGLIDTGVEHVRDVGPGEDSITRVPSITGTLPSRWGVRGAEDLGGGLRGVFTIEGGFGPDSGTQNQGRLYGRQAFVGLSGNWGAVTVGRQYTMLFWSLIDSDILGPNIYGSGSIDAYIPNSRADNSLAYKGTFAGFTVGATYSFGRDAAVAPPSPSTTNCAGESPTDTSACREWSAMLKYDATQWGVAAGFDRLYGGPGAFGGLVSSDLRDDRTTLNGYYKLGDLKLGAGVIRRDNDGAPAPRSHLYYLGAAYLLTPAFTVDGEVFRLSVSDSPNEATMFALRGTYSLSKRTAAYVTAGRISNDGTLNLSVSSGAPGSNPAPGESQTAVMIGVRHGF